LIVMLPAVTVAVGNATALRINPRLPAETVTAKGTPARGSVPSPMSTVAVPLKVALPWCTQAHRLELARCRAVPGGEDPCAQLSGS